MRPGSGCGVLLAVLCLAGCGGGGGKPVPVSGVVTLDGTPLANARVTFNPINEGGRMATGQTDAEGRFKLQTYKPGDGALPGDYKLTVEYLGPMQEADPNLVKDVKKMFEERDRLAKTPRKKLHENYTSLKKSQLRQVVPADGEVRIVLTKDGG